MANESERRMEYLIPGEKKIIQQIETPAFVEDGAATGFGFPFGFPFGFMRSVEVGWMGGRSGLRMHSASGFPSASLPIPPEGGTTNMRHRMRKKGADRDVRSSAFMLSVEVGRMEVEGVCECTRLRIFIHIPSGSA